MSIFTKNHVVDLSAFFPVNATDSTQGGPEGDGLDNSTSQQDAWVWTCTDDNPCRVQKNHQ